MDDSTIVLSDGIRQALQAVDCDRVHRRYWEQNGGKLLFLGNAMFDHNRSTKMLSPANV